MFNVLKSAVVYTVTYIAIFTCTLWALILLIVTVQAFWKAFIMMFALVFALFTWDYVKARKVVAPTREELAARGKSLLDEIIAINKARKA